MGERAKKIFAWLSKLFFISFIQTLVFFITIFILERSGMFMMRVHNYNEQIIYGGEVGAFFFGLILISDIVAEGIRYLINRKR